MSNTAPSSNSAPRAPKRTSTPRAPKRTRTTRVDAPQSIPSDSDDVDDEIPVSFAGDPEIMQHNDACAPVIRDALDFDEVIVPRSSAQASIKWSAVNHDRLEIEVNGVDQQHLETTKRLAVKTVAKAKNILGKGTSDSLSRLDCVHIFLDRHFHLQLEDHIRRRGTADISFEELVSVQKIWMLMGIYGEGYTTIFDDVEWYPGAASCIEKKRYKEIMCSLNKANPSSTTTSYPIVVDHF